MREFINIMRLMEAKIVYQNDTPTGRLVILSNPQRSEIKALLVNSREKSLRALVSANLIYVWDAYYANHDQVESLLNLTGYEQITINDGAIELDRADDEYDPTGEDDFGDPEWELDQEARKLGRRIIDENIVLRRLFDGWGVSIVITLVDDGWEESETYDCGTV